MGIYWEIATFFFAAPGGASVAGARTGGPGGVYVAPFLSVGGVSCPVVAPLYSFQQPTGVHLLVKQRRMAQDSDTTDEKPVVGVCL